MEIDKTVLAIKLKAYQDGIAKQQPIGSWCFSMMLMADKNQMPSIAFKEIGEIPIPLPPQVSRIRKIVCFIN